KSVLRAAGVPCARYRLADSADAAAGFAAEAGFPLVVKPPAGAGAKSTFRLDDAQDLQVWLSVAPPAPDRPALIEEFLTGGEVAARPAGAQITSMLCYVHDFDFYRSWAQLMVHDSFEPPPRLWSAGTVYLRGQGVGRVQAVRGLDRLPPEVSSLVVESRLPEP